MTTTLTADSLGSVSDFKVADLSWPYSAARRSPWPSTRCPGLMSLRAEFGKAQPFKGKRIVGSLHMTVQPPS